MFEPTGPYHRAIERVLVVSGVPFVKVNPRWGAVFAEATGKLVKTDRLDAAILARMGALLEWRRARPEARSRWKCQEFCAGARFFDRALTKRLPNMMAKWVLASAHSLPAPSIIRTIEEGFPDRRASAG